MPIYEYKCEKCDSVFERLAKNSDDHAGECPACHAPKPRKLFSSFAPGVGKSSQAAACPAASECPSGACCNGGNCPI